MAKAFVNAKELPTQSWASGGKVHIPFVSLPEDCRCTHVELELELVLTNNDVAAPIAVAPSDIIIVAQNIDVDVELYTLRGTGRLLRCMLQAMRGEILPETTVSCTHGGVATIVRCMMVVPFSDPDAFEPHDTAMPTGLLEGHTIDLTTKTLGIIKGDADLVITSGSWRATCFFIPGNGDVLPSKQRIDYEDWAQATANLKPGNVSHAIIYDETDLAVTTAEYSRITIQANGQACLNKIRAQYLLCEFNYKTAKSSADMLPIQDAASAAFIPVLTQRKGYKQSEMLDATRGLQVDIDSGSLTGARWAYRQIVPRTGSEEIQALTKLKVPNPEAATVEVKTASKTALRGPAAKVAANRARLPLRFNRA